MVSCPIRTKKSSTIPKTPLTKYINCPKVASQVLYRAEKTMLLMHIKTQVYINVLFFRFKTYIPWLLVPFASILYEWTPHFYTAVITAYYQEFYNSIMPDVYKDDLYTLIINNFEASSLWGRVQELYKYFDFVSQATCALFIVVIANRLFLKLPDFLKTSPKTNIKTNINDTQQTHKELKETARECESHLRELKQNVSIINEIEQMLSEQLESYLKESKKSEQEIKDHLKKTLQNQLDVKFENLEIELKKNQKEQFADLKNQQKLFLTKQQNNPQKAEFLEQKFTEIKEKAKQNFDDQNRMLEKQNEDLKKQLSQIKTSINNQTRQQGILQNLVLDLKNSDDNSDQARAQGNILRGIEKKTVEKEGISICLLMFSSQ